MIVGDDLDEIRAIRVGIWEEVRGLGDNSHHGPASHAYAC